MPRFPLASEGSWVELRDPQELRYGDKQNVLRSLNQVERQVSAGIDMTNAIIALMVINWQLPSPLPVPAQDITVIDRLTLADGAALEKLIEPTRELLFPTSPEPQTAEEQAKAAGDPASPTTPTGDSSPASTVGPFPATIQ